MNESPPFVHETRVEHASTRQPIAQAPPDRAPAGQPAVAVSSSGIAEVDRTRVYAGGPAYRGIQLVWFLLGLTELIIGLRVLFRALGVSDTGFVAFISGLGGTLAAPFRVIANYTAGTAVVEIGSLIAMVVYLMVAFLVFKLVRIATAPRRTEARI
jgi:hypothetical protein